MMVVAFDGQPGSAEAVLGLLLPIWQLVIGTTVLLVLIVTLRRLVRRGRSRMSTALMVTGGAIVGLTVLGILLRGG